LYLAEGIQGQHVTVTIHAHFCDKFCQWEEQTYVKRHEVMKRERLGERKRGREIGREKERESEEEKERKKREKDSKNMISKRG
jgi:hypothetical protein